MSVDYCLYLIAWDLDLADWRTFRVDRIDSSIRSGKKFAPASFPNPIQSSKCTVRSDPCSQRIRAIIQAPAERVKQEVAHH